MAEMHSGDEADNFCSNQSVTVGLNEVLCNTEAEEYFKNIKLELNQIDRLVSDAVNNLVINFKYITKLTKSHHEMVLAIEKMAIPKGNKSIIELLEKQMVIADKIELELDAAITSLQFGDLVTQLLSHTTRQVEILSMELQRLDLKGNWKTDIAILEAMQKRISCAVNVAQTKNERKPVVQQGMQMGDVELF